MTLYFKQRLFSWLDSYDIFDENGETVFTVEGAFSFGKCLHIYDKDHKYVGSVKQRLLTFLPQFEAYLGDEYIGVIRKEFSFFKPSFTIEYLGWSVDGDFFEWDYSIYDGMGDCIASVSKELFRFTDTYSIHVVHPDFAVQALMLVLAIDAEKDSRN